MVRSVTVLLGILAFLGIKPLKAQDTGYFKIKGDINKYYIVTFKDGAQADHRASELELSRTNVHEDSSWRGTVIAKFRYHADNVGHGSSFIDGDVRQKSPFSNTFVAGWKDVSYDNGSKNIIIWLRGNTSYHFRANYDVSPVVHDGVAAPIDYQPGGTLFTLKSAVDSYVNTYGTSSGNTAYYTGTGTNYIAGGLAIGTPTANAGAFKLAVEGPIRARRVKVDQETWADFVFEPDYKLPSLQELEAYIKLYKHLPGVPSAEEVATEKLDLGEMNKILLQKIEELTLHLIEQEKKNAEQQMQINQLLEKQ